MSKNEIILRNPKQGALVKANKQSQTFLTLLQQSDEQRLIDILKSINFEDATRLISRLEHIEWTAEFIEKYAEYWDWRKLSWNKDLPWSMELIERFEDSWNFLWLSWNKALPWSIELIERFEERWDWGEFGLSDNEALPWSIALIERFEDRWVWSWLSCNEALPWSIDLLEKFKYKWSWPDLALVQQIFTALSVQGIEEVMDYHIEED
ncbi:hypothetical protein OLL86_10350 [Gallibacterium anatis]|uniref:hypothetical protein n=1 Tax=Gallibacterium anatis TaxID=750 RepID=UPI0022315E9B|nr:hypothetical protein [Gallibacterium anatis]UZD15878.1 hypothetical protein OLL86_10350 [Gallibacterium anatis]